MLEILYSSTVTVVDLGEGPPPPSIFRPNWGPKDQKKFLDTAPPYLRVWMT